MTAGTVAGCLALSAQAGAGPVAFAAVGASHGHAAASDGVQGTWSQTGRMETGTGDGSKATALKNGSTYIVVRDA